MAIVLLSFDTEEFDVPREHGVEISLDQAMRVSVSGTERILDCLRRHGVQGTFFVTGNYANQAPEVVRRIVAEGHEVACHGVDHTHPADTDYEVSREIVERVSGQRVQGWRQPRMFATDDARLAQLGYRYNSSINPAVIPGRYVHLDVPRTWFERDGVVQIPASVTPWLRFPLFWLSLHHLPQGLYRRLVDRVLSHDGYFATYFHPWEFYPIGEHPEYRIPWIIRRHCGDDMAARLDALITHLQARGHRFMTYGAFCDEVAH